MERTVADRELRGNTGTRFAFAEMADDAAIRQLLRENPMRGAISMSFEREPAYFIGANVAGGRDRTIIAFSAGRLACVGRCTRRVSWVDGRETPIGYLAELRLDQVARGRFGILRDGYRFFHDQECNDRAEVYFTSIAADNETARRLLERGARGLPAYEFLAEIDTVIVPVPCRPRATRLRITKACPGDLPVMLRVLNDHGRRHQLGAVWTEEKLCGLNQHGLPLDRFLIVREGGEAVACGALWDQRDFRQTVIRGYSPWLAFFRPVLNTASGLFGTPRLPPSGATLASAFISPLAFVNGAANLLPDFVDGFFGLAAERGVEFLTIGLPAGSAGAHALRQRFSTRTWRSRLYQVQWDGEPGIQLQGGDAVFQPDIALL